MAVWRAADATIDTLRVLGMEEVCFIGGLAAKLYGNDREPNDVDVLILESPYGQETIKRKVAEENPCFYLIPAKTTGANWKLLWYHPDGESSTGYPAPIKIDILVPGSAELPSFNPRRIDYHNEHVLPAAPLLLVLLHKVLGWWRRMNSSDNHHYQKHWQDARDVANLVVLASQLGVTIDGHVLPENFIDSAREYVNEFIAAYPKVQTRYYWRRIGFRTSTQVFQLEPP